MFVDFRNRDKFYQTYISLFATRFTYGSLNLENSKQSIDNYHRAIEVYNNINAFENLLASDKGKLYPYDIQSVNADVTRDLDGLPFGYRKVNIQIKGAKFEPSDKYDVPNDMMNLLNNYYNIWDMLHPFEREARFHIHFIKIHPFENGNGRSGRIIMNYHLCRKEFAPVIISKEDRKDYFRFIEKEDYDGFACYLEQASKKELEVMKDIFNRVYGNKKGNKQLIKNFN